MAAEAVGEDRFIKCSVTTCKQRAQDAARDLFIDGPDGPLTQRTLSGSAWPGVCWDHGAGYLVILRMLEPPLKWPLRAVNSGGETRPC